MTSLATYIPDILIEVSGVAQEMNFVHLYNTETRDAGHIKR